jgi:hypothetical protein
MSNSTPGYRPSTFSAWPAFVEAEFHRVEQALNAWL